MDWGDNPVVSSMLLKEYRNSADKLAAEDVELETLTYTKAKHCRS